MKGVTIAAVVLVEMVAVRGAAGQASSVAISKETGIIALTAAASGSGEMATEAATGRGDKTRSDGAVDVGRRWLSALAEEDGEKLAVLSSFPFRYATTNKTKTCEVLVASEKGVRSLLKCLAKHEEWLLQGVRKYRKLRLENCSQRRLSEEMNTQVGAYGKAEQLVCGFVRGEGLGYNLVLVVGARGRGMAVKTLVIDVEFDEG